MIYPIRITRINDGLVRSLMKYIYRDVHRNKFGYFGINTGPPGHSKSETSLLQAWIQDPELTEDTMKFKYFFGAKPFLKFVNEANKHEWGIWDETGITFSSKKWNTLSNILVEDVCQTMRIQLLGISFVTQDISFVDNRARRLLQWFTEVKRFELNPPIWKIHRVKLNQMKDKIFFPYPLFRYQEKMVKLRQIKIEGRLPLNLRNKFDELHVAWKEMMMKKHKTIIDTIIQEESPLDIWEMIELVQKNPKKYLNKKGKLDADLIMLDLEIGRSRASQIVKFLTKDDSEDIQKPKKTKKKLSGDLEDPGPPDG